jgi:6-pyruvoyltetrahydropterin/6-carboxytetrahydropterin synthase
MPESFHVRIAKAEHTFSAAHFITFDGNHCERLHGHNYHVAAEVEGPLDANQYVVDFLALREELASITSRLDHRMLLPTEHPLISVEDDGEEVTAQFEDRRWIFPRGDCCLIPVANMTAELLARYIAQQLREAMERRFLGFSPKRLRVELDECDGQAGVYEWTEA